MDKRNADTENKACPNCRLRDLFAEQSVEERTEKRTCKRALGIGHQGRDRCILMKCN